MKVAPALGCTFVAVVLCTVVTHKKGINRDGSANAAFNFLGGWCESAHGKFAFVKGCSGRF